MLPACWAILTPAGTGIGLRPIRDIFCSLTSLRLAGLRTRHYIRHLYRLAASAYCLLNRGAACCAPTKPLPDLAENLAANFRLAGGASAHQAFRRGENADAQATYDRANVGAAEITARAGTRNALHAGDNAAAVGRVLEEHAKDLAGLVLVDQLEGGNVTFFLQDARYLGF